MEDALRARTVLRRRDAAFGIVVRHVGVRAILDHLIFVAVLPGHCRKHGCSFRPERRGNQEGLDLPLPLQLDVASLFDLNSVGQVLVSLLPELQLAHLALLHEARRRVDRVAKEAVAGQPRADDPRDDGPRVQAHLEANRLSLEIQDLVGCCDQAAKDLGVSFSRILRDVLRHDADASDILLADRLNLRDSVLLHDPVELGEVLVEEGQDLCRPIRLGYLVEAIDEDEQDGDSVYRLCNDLPRPLDHRGDHVDRHHALQNLEQPPTGLPHPEVGQKRRSLHPLYEGLLREGYEKD
mmetsp:Transcript_69497/g.214813  ORF Transcript_69497/g.214813 Transcript_69497/m.214813 type:complete len:295 (+) Transcript_69497:1648-2532(+)